MRKIKMDNIMKEKDYVQEKKHLLKDYVQQQWNTRKNIEVEKWIS